MSSESRGVCFPSDNSQRDPFLCTASICRLAVEERRYLLWCLCQSTGNKLQKGENKELKLPLGFRRLRLNEASQKRRECELLVVWAQDVNDKPIQRLKSHSTWKLKWKNKIKKIIHFTLFLKYEPNNMQLQPKNKQQKKTNIFFLKFF